MSLYQARNAGDASRLARLMLTSSDAELLGGQLHEMQGYAELVDALASQGASPQAAVLAPSAAGGSTPQGRASGSAS